MGDITGKTVYILGAGASAHVGAPLLQDFLIKARNLYESRSDLVYGESFQQVFEWLNSLRASSYYVESDLENLEHVFCLAEMQRQLNLAEGPRVYDHLKRVLVETLDQCEVTRQGQLVEPDHDYSLFVKRLMSSNEERRNRAGNTTFSRDSVITFNYDVFLDHAFWGRSAPPTYGLGTGQTVNAPSESGMFRLLKLHGSANWAVCQECQKRAEPGVPRSIQVLKPSPWAPPEGVRFFPEEKGRERFRMVTESLRNTACNKCGAKELFPHVLPPTWSKWVLNDPVAQVWKEAVQELQHAFQLIVIGYSLPRTDTFFRYLLTLGLAKSQDLFRVVVVNRDTSEPFRHRYREVFARSLDDRGRLVFSKARDFETFSGGNFTEAFQKFDASSG